MDTFYALAEPNRREILNLLAESGQMPSSAIASRLPAISKAAVSQHLKVLREAQLVSVQKQAQKRIYQLNPMAMAEVEDWAQQMVRQWNKRFDALDKMLAKEQAKQKGASHGKRK